LYDWHIGVMSAATALGVALSTYLPWFDATTEHFAPRSRFLLPPIGGSTHAPGTTFWGHLVFTAALVVAVIAGAEALATLRNLRTIRVVRRAVVAIATAVMLLLVVLEANASPPFGDGPRMRTAWGAFLGLLVALASVTTAGWALAKTLRTDRGR
jgi:hypothetical protein